MSSIIGFFDSNRLRAVRMEGLLTQNRKTNYWQLKHGSVSMPFPHTILLLDNCEIDMLVKCVASSHIPFHMTTKKVLYHHSVPPSSSGISPTLGLITIHMAGVNVHSVRIKGVIHKTVGGSWGLIDPELGKMPIGAAFKQLECRMVEIEIDNIYTSALPILQCNRTVLYP